MEGECIKHNFVIPLYDIGVTVYVSSDMIHNVTTANKDFGIKIENSNCLAKSIQFSSGSETKFAMLIKDDDKMAQVIAHESLHLSWYICEYLGIKLNYENHEAQAYILEHIVGKVNNFLI